MGAAQPQPARFWENVAAHRGSNDLPDDLVADLRGEIDWTRYQDELLSQRGACGTTGVSSASASCGRSSFASSVRGSSVNSRVDGPLILRFAAGAQPMDASLQVGSRFDDELVLDPSAVPLRALRKEQTAPARQIAAGNLPFGLSLGQGLKPAAATLARNPWVERWPIPQWEAAADGAERACR